MRLLRIYMCHEDFLVLATEASIRHLVIQPQNQEMLSSSVQENEKSNLKLVSWRLHLKVKFSLSSTSISSCPTPTRHNCSASHLHSQWCLSHCITRYSYLFPSTSSRFVHKAMNVIFHSNAHVDCFWASHISCGIAKHQGKAPTHDQHLPNATWEEGNTELTSSYGVHCSVIFFLQVLQLRGPQLVAKWQWFRPRLPKPYTWLDLNCSHKWRSTLPPDQKQISQ